MDVFWLIAVVAAAGALGGLLNSVIAGELHWPRTDTKAKVWRPGWVGNVLSGAGAAFVNWSLNGPIGGIDFFHLKPEELHFTPAQAAAALVVGIAGGRYLTGEARRRILKHELDEEKEARKTLATATPRKPRTHGNNPGAGA